MIIDTHCHLNFKAFASDRHQVIKRSIKDGVGLLVVSTDFKTSQLAVDLAKQHQFVWAAVGFHPIHVFSRDWQKELPAIGRLAEEREVVAIGEVGFDRFRLPDLERQNEYFLAQEQVFNYFVRLAQSLSKPMIIHNRQAKSVLIDRLNSGALDGIRFVQHCFSASLDDAQAIIRWGHFISFTGLVTRSHGWDEVIRQIPLKSMMIETDSPYLTPKRYGDQRNEPRYVLEVAKKIAQIKARPVSEVINQTTKNAVKFFKLEIPSKNN